MQLYVTAHVHVKNFIRRVFSVIRKRSRILLDRSCIMFAMEKRKKNPYAVALGRRGGKKGGPARAAAMTPEERSDSARKAVLARWERERESKKPE